jgi:hypothetical protein
VYSVTTDTGLSFDAADPIDLGEALHAELTTHRAEGPISYSITRDGNPQHDGWIVLSSSSEGSADFIRDSVQRLVDAMIIQAAYDAHALQQRG